MSSVSVIVPVYNVEEYLSRCIDGILNQSFNDFELILIDDGSLDKSGRICDEYSKKDSRIRVFHKKNGGVSSARNLGIDKAIGEYVMFVDSDDVIASSTLQRCYTYASTNDIDLLQYSLTRQYDELGNIKGVTPPMSVLDYINENRLIVGIGGSFIKRSIIQEHKLRFDESLKLAEDLIFIHNILAHSQKCQRIYDLLYYYRDNINSSSNNKRTEDMMKSCMAEIELKKRCPQFDATIDYSITLYILSIIINNDYDREKLCELIKNSLPYNRTRMRGTQLIFSIVSMINICTAIKLVKLKFRVK